MFRFPALQVCVWWMGLLSRIQDPILQRKSTGESRSFKSTPNSATRQMDGRVSTRMRQRVTYSNPRINARYPIQRCCRVCAARRA